MKFGSEAFSEPSLLKFRTFFIPSKLFQVFYKQVSCLSFPTDFFMFCL